MRDEKLLLMLNVIIAENVMGQTLFHEPGVMGTINWSDGQVDVQTNCRGCQRPFTPMEYISMTERCPPMAPQYSSNDTLAIMVAERYKGDQATGMSIETNLCNGEWWTKAYFQGGSSQVIVDKSFAYAVCVAIVDALTQQRLRNKTVSH